MKTVDKAMSVLDQFSLDHKEIGLSEMARLTNLDKAATRRLLVALSEHGFVEQDKDSRKYRLGHGFLRLASIRDATVPTERAAQEVSDWLADAVGETSHVSLPGPHAMTSVAHRIPHKGNVINMIGAQNLAYHATSSGIAYLAFASEAERNRILDQKREQKTQYTLVDLAALRTQLEETRARGYARMRNTFEIGVASIAMPFFLDGDDPAGCIAIAVPDANMNAERIEQLRGPLSEAVKRLELSLTGRKPG